MEIDKVFFEKHRISIFYKAIDKTTENSMKASENYRYYKCVISSSDIYARMYEYIEKRGDDIIINAELLEINSN